MQQLPRNESAANLPVRDQNSLIKPVGKCTSGVRNEPAPGQIRPRSLVHGCTAACEDRRNLTLSNLEGILLHFFKGSVLACKGCGASLEDEKPVKVERRHRPFLENYLAAGSETTLCQEYEYVV